MKRSIDKGALRTKFHLSLSMLGWALNEEENVGPYIERAEAFLKATADDYELILIDDGSTDRTLEIATQYQKTRPWLKIHVNDKTRGPGYNTKKAISLATKDYLLWQTVDWAYDIALLGRSLHLLQRYDVLQGVRTCSLSIKGAIGQRSDNPYKAVVSMVNYWLIRVLFRLPLHDYQNVTVYPRRLIQSVELETESSFTNPECLLKTWWRGTTIKEVPVEFSKRERGKAKGTRPKAIAAAIRDIFYWWFIWIVLGRRRDKNRGRVIYWNEQAQEDTMEFSSDIL